MTKKSKSTKKRREARKKVVRNTTNHDTENKPVETTKRKWRDEYTFIIYDLVKEGLDSKQIAAFLNVRYFTLKRWIRDRPALKAAIMKARKNDKSEIYKHLTNVQQRALLGAFMVIGTIMEAARVSRISISNHTRWLQDDEEYVEAYAHAKRFLNEELEREARRRAIDGVQTLKFHNGLVITIPCEENDPLGWAVDTVVNGEEKTVWVKPYVEHKYSDALLMFMMKAKDPAQFGDKQTIEQTGVTTHVQVDLNTIMAQIENTEVMTPERVQEKAQQLIEAHKGSATEE